MASMGHRACSLSKKLSCCGSNNLKPLITSWIIHILSLQSLIFNIKSEITKERIKITGTNMAGLIKFYSILLDQFLLNLFLKDFLI